MSNSIEDENCLIIEQNEANLNGWILKSMETIKDSLLNVGLEDALGSFNNK